MALDPSKDIFNVIGSSLFLMIGQIFVPPPPKEEVKGPSPVLEPQALGFILNEILTKTNFNRLKDFYNQNAEMIDDYISAFNYDAMNYPGIFAKFILIFSSPIFSKQIYLRVWNEAIANAPSIFHESLLPPNTNALGGAELYKVNGKYMLEISDTLASVKEILEARGAGMERGKQEGLLALYTDS